MRDAVHQFQLDQPIGQQPQRPAGLAFGRRRATQGQQLRFQVAIDQQVVLALGGLAVQRQVQPFQDKLLFNPVHLALAHAEHGRDVAGAGPLGAAPGLITVEQYKALLTLDAACVPLPAMSYSSALSCSDKLTL